MSDTGLYFKMQESLGSNKRLSAFYDFGSSSEIDSLGAGSEFTGVLVNSPLSNNGNIHSGYSLASFGSSSSAAENKLSAMISGDKFPLYSGNFKIPLDGLNANNISAIIDFEFNGSVDDGILLGCFKKNTETIGSTTIKNSEGFNVGVTDRGHLFCQTFGENGDAIDVITSIELSKRNVIGLSISDSSLSLSRFDYFNGLVRSVEIPVDENYTSHTESLVFGGSNTYFRSTESSDETFSGSLNSVALFSGFFDEQFLKELGEGIIGDYSYAAPVETQRVRTTGYNETIIYKTGITGYNYQSTGTLTIVTGREYIEGSFSTDSSASKEEGERYYKYYTLNNGDSQTFYKEELGKLHSNSGYVYYPTGEDAFDTLGLNNISESIQTYTETSGIKHDTITIDLYGKSPLTGTLSEISGVSRTALQETYSVFTTASSGVILSGDSEDLKKNFIYYMGDRS